MILETGRRVLAAEGQAILNLIERLDERFVRAVEMLSECRGRLVITGMGKSGIIAKKIASTMASGGVPSLFLHPAEGVHGDLGMIAAGDVVVALSNTGETEELVALLPYIKRLGIGLIALTGNLASTLARRADVVLDVSVEAEACEIGPMPTVSTTAALAMGDALAVALIEKKGFRQDDFAILHPAAGLGRRLLTVGELMHTGDAIPRVLDSTPLKDIIYEISSKKLGTTTVVNNEGELLGIITDGDLRRLMEARDDLRLVVAKEFMTLHPKVIDRDALVTRALKVMEDHTITSLLIVDEAHLLEGLIHLHDILKAGIV
ncbi:MAG: KpsF/GutQ family sugar-phosphate isomerase [Nitrospinae bacterium]|nr:KpsF/GutQ family sugar-phosphate isomerase [Nitrospinota bacterium]